MNDSCYKLKYEKFESGHFSVINSSSFIDQFLTVDNLKVFVRICTISHSSHHHETEPLSYTLRQTKWLTFTIVGRSSLGTHKQKEHALIHLLPSSLA